MRSSTIFLSRLIGLFTLILSLSMVAQRQLITETMSTMIYDRPLLLVLGMIALAAGLSIVLTHNIWTAGALPLVVTLIGWVILIRGIILLLMPSEALASLFAMFHFEDFFYLYAAISFALGFYLTYMGFRRSRP